MSNNTIALTIFITVCVLINYFIYHKNKKNPKILLIMLGSVFGTMILLTAGMYTSTRQNSRIDFKANLEKIDKSIAVVKIDGEITDLPPEKIINAMMKIKNYAAHNSFPEQKFEFIIKDDKTNVKFNLARDSQNINEYWIFINNYEIGRVRTLVFNNQ